MEAVPPLFRRLVDDAALYPPGSAPMASAVPAHRMWRSGPHADLVGPFLCPASRWDELRSRLRAGDCLELGLIVDTGIDAIRGSAAAAMDDERVRLIMVEVPVPAGQDLVRGATQAIEQTPAGVRLHVELPRSPSWTEPVRSQPLGLALDVLAAAGQGAKLRTGGLRADLFPTDAEVAAFIVACVERSVPFKCTAGLHQAVRHTDPISGFEHHGFLNLVVAAARAVSGGRVREALAEARPEALAAEAASIDAATASAARAAFTSYGSCSIDEPLTDLRDLGLLP